MKMGWMDIKSKITGARVTVDINLNIDATNYQLVIRFSKSEIEKTATLMDILNCLNKNESLDFKLGENYTIISEPETYDKIDGFFLTRELENNAVSINVKKKDKVEAEIMMDVL